MESNEFLGKSIGACLAGSENLTAAYVPEGVSEATARAIVRSANKQRTASPTFAILVSSAADSELDPTCPVVSPANSIRYRQGDRLAVVSGRHPDLASFVGAFRESLSQSFPDSAAGVISLDNVARRIIDEIFDWLGIDSTRILDRKTADERLSLCLQQLGDAHREQREGATGWNARWFEQATTGCDHLAQLIQLKSATDPGLDLDELFAKYTYASFGFPLPDLGTSLGLKQRRLGRSIAEAIEAFWGDADTIRSSSKQLAHHPDTEGASHPLAQLDWSRFDQDLAAMDSHLLAWSCVAEASSSRTEAFAQLTESQYFNPMGQGKDGGQLSLLGTDDQNLSLGDGPGGPYVLVTKSTSPEGDVASETFVVRIPTLATIDTNLVAGSKLRIVPSSNKHTLEGALSVIDGALCFVGRLKWKAPKKSAASWVASLGSGKLLVSVNADDELAGTVVTTAACEYIAIPPVTICAVHWRLDSKGNARTAKYLGPETFGDPASPQTDIPFIANLAATDSRVQVVVLADSPISDPLLDGKVLPQLHERTGLYSAVFQPTGTNEVAANGAAFEFRATQPSVGQQSPVVAAVYRNDPSPAPPSDETLHSLRGVIETYITESINIPEWEDAHGHIILPSDREVSAQNLEMDADGLLMPRDVRELLKVNSDFVVPEELLGSAEAEDFIQAFRQLRISESMSTHTSEGTPRVEWPSKTSWRHLAEHRDGVLDRYLTTYVRLIEHAKTIGSASGIFWATYPFSLSVWDVEGSGSCQAVLLSPLHPVRLAWLSSAESTLWKATGASRLAGTVEGWNFPIVGPRETSNGRMLAVPIDNGEDQLFLGWSMMVTASIDGERSLSAPHRIGDLPAPGSAASGLNATAVAAALRSYRGMNPHISTLTLDLAASEPTVRLPEIDEAVMAAVSEWTARESDALRGGVRVWDSLNREGDIPRDKAIILARSTSGTPFVWSRYEHDAKETRACNLRLLQSSGVRVEVATSLESNLGVIASVPLRRFEAFDGGVEGTGVSESYPALRRTDGWEPFSLALMAVENFGGTPVIRSKITKSLLVDQRADWTVSGEAMIAPSAMASLLRHKSHGEQMLWEWRPPFLESNHDIPVLERRPFISVARVPAGFRGQISDMLDKAHGRAVSENEVNDLLGTLGARGVGLSSLLSMGGTHASGALGFYLAFSLMDSIDPRGADQFVLPIDACEAFLAALAPAGGSLGLTRRADLLVASLTDDGLVLSPIEVKFYGFDSDEPSHLLPKPGQHALDEAVEQLESTQDLLLKVVAQQHSDMNESDRALWNNGLAALVDAGARLRPSEIVRTGRFADRFQRLANGEIPVRAGKPLLTFFRHQASTADGRSHSTHLGVPTSADTQVSYGALIANVEAAFAQTSSRSGAIVEDWQSIVDWAVKEEPAPDFPSPQENSSPKAPELPPAPVTSGISKETPSSSAPDSGVAQSPKNGTGTPTPQEQSGVSGDGIRFAVGALLGTVGNGEADFWPSNTELTQMNVGVVGDLGTGKTQLLKSLVYQLRKQAPVAQEAPLSFLIFDYKKDFLHPDFLNAVGGEVLRPHRIPLNVFALSEPYTPFAALQRANAFCDVIGKIYTGVGPVQRDRLVTAIMAHFKDHNGTAPTLSQVLEAYRANGKLDAVTSILNTFVLGEIFSETGPLQSFEELLDGKVLVLALSDLGADQNAKNALVVLFLNMYYEHMLASRKWPFSGEDPQLRQLNSFLLIDEAKNIMKYDFPVLMDLMLQGREFGFGTILASQYLSHFKTNNTNYGEPLLTWFIHKVPNVTAKELAQLGLGNISSNVVERIGDLNKHQTLYSSLGFPGRLIAGTPFYSLMGPETESPPNHGTGEISPPKR